MLWFGVPYAGGPSVGVAGAAQGAGLAAGTAGAVGTVTAGTVVLGAGALAGIAGVTFFAIQQDEDPVPTDSTD